MKKWSQIHPQRYETLISSNRKHSLALQEDQQVTVFSLLYEELQRDFSQIAFVYNADIDKYQITGNE